MADIVVAPDDKQLFLDKVIKFGIDHGILTLERRQELARESAGLSPSLCERYGLNPMAIADVLLAARVVHQLASVGLERISQDGNILTVAHLLATVKISALVGAAQTMLDESYQRLWSAVKHSCYIPYFSPYRYGNLISIMFGMIILQQAPYYSDMKGYSFSRSPIDLNSEADRKVHMQALRRALRKEQCEIALSLHTSRDLDRWLDEVNAKVREITSQGAQKRKRRQ